MNELRIGGYGISRLGPGQPCVCDTGNTTRIMTPNGDDSCQCQAGFMRTTSTSTGDDICIECGINEWSTGRNSICQSCPDNSTTLNRTGSISVLNCSCIAGYYLNTSSSYCNGSYIFIHFPSFINN
jgi:hypothetical protein